MINSATHSPRLMGSSYTPPVGQQQVEFKMAGGFKPPAMAPDVQSKFPPKPALAPPPDMAKGLDALNLTPPTGIPQPPPAPAQSHLNPLSHETVNGAYVKLGFEKLHAHINDTVAQQRKMAQIAFERKVVVKKSSHHKVQIFNSSLSMVEQMNQKAFDAQQVTSSAQALKAYVNTISDHKNARHVEAKSQVSLQIGQATLDNNLASEKVAHYSRTIEAQNSKDNVKDNQRVSKDQNRERILAGNQHYKAQINDKALVHHQSLDSTNQTLRRTTLAHRAYSQHVSDAHVVSKAKNIYHSQGEQIKVEKQKTTHNRETAIHDHYQASDFKRAAAAQLYSANDRAGSKALTIKDRSGAMAY